MEYEHVIVRGPAGKKRCCPFLAKDWIPGDRAGVYECPNCHDHALSCETDQEAIALARNGQLVAIKRPSYQALSELGEIFTGSPKVTSEESNAISSFPVINAKIDVLEDIKMCDRVCEECGFPIKSYHKTCRVCAEKNTDRRARIKEIERERRRIAKIRRKAVKLSNEQRLKEVLKPAWNITVQPACEELPRTASKFGGIPYLEKGEDWPVCHVCRKNMAFICQADVGDTETGRDLGVGFFTFFFCWDCDESDHDDGQTQNRVRFYAMASEEKLSDPPEVALSYDFISPHPERGLTLEKTLCAPDDEEMEDYAPELAEILSVEHPGDPYEAYRTLVDQVGAINEPHSHIGGYGWWIQGSESQRTSILFAQIHSSETDCPVFGDGGSVYLLVEPESLKVGLVFQCY